MEFEEEYYLGYILLQLGNVDDALKHLKKKPPNFRNPDVSLVSARSRRKRLGKPLATYALKDMQTSIGKGYVPTHERFLPGKIYRQRF